MIDILSKYQDLREWIKLINEFGELRFIQGASPELEIGTITDIVCHSNRRDAILFEDIPGYSKTCRILVNPLGSIKRLALTLGLKAEKIKDLIDQLAFKISSLNPIPPIEVNYGPILENQIFGNNIDINKFPAPHWHPKDGGRYIGTGSITITRDPEEGWVNLGTYRVMIIDKDKLSFYISPGKHGRIHRDKYFNTKKSCPVAISFGHDPLLFFVGAMEWPYGESEYDIAGGFKGSPIEIIKGKFTGLPLPARAELVIEGEAIPGDYSSEGPFGEWTGYYASGVREEVTIKIKAIYHRNDPIILGAPALKPPNGNSFFGAIFRSAKLKRDFQLNGTPGIVDVWFPEEGGGRLLCIVSIKQLYPGHAKQVGLLAMANPSSAYMGRYVIVVDDDIDVTNLGDVIWAVLTRSDPIKDIDVIRRLWSGPLDPILTKEDCNQSSRAIIDACRPFERISNFPSVIDIDQETKNRVLKKWGDIINKS